MTQTVRTVDLFCGCGGLSLGFELFDGSIEFKTTMALDNDHATIRCYNANRSSNSSLLGIARLCDVNWFNHPSEVLLYYLTHTAIAESDVTLLAALEEPEIGLSQFLGRLRRIDAECERSMRELVASDCYKSAFDKVDSKIFSIAICRAYLSRIGLSSLRTGTLATAQAPWVEEYLAMEAGKATGDHFDHLEVITAISESLSAKWDTEITNLKEASLKEGKGQHKTVSARLSTLVSYLEGVAGHQLKCAWLEWRSRRDSVRATFCTRVHSKLLDLYSGSRKVGLVLGGPPCKGFSRIGRAVIESLRNQGVHAWASKEYGDERNALLHKYVLFLEALRPDVFLFENVAHFQSGLRTPSGTLDAVTALKQAINDLASTDLHYDVCARVIKAREHAIPQDRSRFILVGFRAGALGEASPNERFFQLNTYQEEVPLETALRGLASPGEFSFGGLVSKTTAHLSAAYTLMDPAMPAADIRYIQWIRQPAPGQIVAPALADAHIVRTLRADDLALVTKFAPGQRWMDYKLRNAATVSEIRSVISTLLQHMESFPSPPLPDRKTLIRLLDRLDESLLLRLILEDVAPGNGLLDSHHLLSHEYLSKGTDKHGDWFERLSADRPCKTIVAHIGKDTYGYIHPYSNRAISIREAARIQSFPDFFSFATTGVVDGYAMIGNAVPPLLANVFANQLAELHVRYGLFGTEHHTGRSGSNRVSKDQPRVVPLFDYDDLKLKSG